MVLKCSLLTPLFCLPKKGINSCSAIHWCRKTVEGRVVGEAGRQRYNKVMFYRGIGLNHPVQGRAELNHGL